MPSLLAAGVALADVQPMNKRLHSPAFALTTGGGALVVLSLTLLLLDSPVRRAALAWRPSWPAGIGAAAAADAVLRWAGTLALGLIQAARTTLAWPFTTLGRNALVVYLGEHLILSALEATAPAVGDSPNLLHLLAFDTFAGAGDRAHLAVTAVVLGVLLAVTTVMRLLRWRIVL